MSRYFLNFSTSLKRRLRGLTAADSEWKLICATHNLLKVYRLA